MTYVILFWEFLKIGLFSFGGAYAAIPLIQDTVLRNHWMTDEMFANVVAISESTPGPIMVNMATYVGSRQGGIAGAFLATFAVVLPSFVIMLLVTIFLRTWLKHRRVQAVLDGIKPCIVGIILAAGIWMGFTAIFGQSVHPTLDVTSLLIFILLATLSILYPKLRKKQLSPILLIVVAAVLGMLL